MPFVKVAQVSQLPEGVALHVEIDDGAIAICNVEGELHALDGICPHSNGPLGDGGLHGRILVCPFHAWEFDCVTGLCTADDTIRQARFPVKVESGDVLVDVPWV